VQEKQISFILLHIESAPKKECDAKITFERLHFKIALNYTAAITPPITVVYLQRGKKKKLISGKQY